MAEPQNNPEEMDEFARAVADQKAAEAKAQEMNRPITEAAEIAGENTPPEVESAQTPAEGPVAEEKAALADNDREETLSAKSQENLAAMDMASRTREVSVSTVVRLMGLSTSGQIDLLERKLDTLSGKLTQVVNRIDRFSGQFSEVFHDFHRVEVQISDLREFMRSAVTAIASEVTELKSGVPTPSAPQATPKATPPPAKEETPAAKKEEKKEEASAE